MPTHTHFLGGSDFEKKIGENTFIIRDLQSGFYSFLLQHGDTLPRDYIRAIKLSNSEDISFIIDRIWGDLLEE